jgi:hypothetical protein
VDILNFLEANVVCVCKAVSNRFTRVGEHICKIDPLKVLQDSNIFHDSLINEDRAAAGRRGGGGRDTH